MVSTVLLLVVPKCEHNVGFFSVLCVFPWSPQVTAAPLWHQPGLSAALIEYCPDPWIWILLWWSCLPSDRWKPGISWYICIHTRVPIQALFFIFLVIQTMIWKCFGLVIYISILLGFRLTKESPSEIKLVFFSLLRQISDYCKYSDFSRIAPDLFKKPNKPQIWRKAGPHVMIFKGK